METYKIIKRPSLTEKSGMVREKGNFYTFHVERGASKKEIKRAVEEMFKVHVIRVNTVMMPGKAKRFGKSTSDAMRFKKAIVKLKKDEKIEIVEGV
jgi:large subunit ribosomal protein L23